MPPTTDHPSPNTEAHSDYRVELDAYAGPLDLLLHLVKRHEIDLHDIPIAELTEQYLRHLELIKEINVDQAGEFLVMAATLLEIKSRMITPAAPAEGEDDDAAGDTSGGDATQDAVDEEAADPRSELVQQLLEYKRIKDAAIGLEQRHHDWSRRFSAHAKATKPDKPEPGVDDPDNAQPIEIDLEDVHVLDLCEAFSRILETVGHIGDHQVTYDDTPISLHAEDIHDRLKRDGNMTLQQIFIGRKTRAEMIGLFLATLELVRQRIVRVVQDRGLDQIMIELRPEDEHITDGIDTDADAETDWTDPQTGQVQYDWPSEEARLRYERRQKRRRKFGKDAEQEDDPVIVDDDDEQDDDDLDDPDDFDDPDPDDLGDEDDDED